MPEWRTTILIADDEPDILSVTTRFLKGCGYTVLTARDGEGALKAFAEAQQTIQLVISDVVMPGMRGPQLMRSIKGLSPSTATLLMSGTWSRVTEDGVALIGKPFTRQKFVAMVKDLLATCNFTEIEREQAIARSQRLKATAATAGSAETSFHRRSCYQGMIPSRPWHAPSLVPNFTNVIQLMTRRRPTLCRISYVNGGYPDCERQSLIAPALVLSTVFLIVQWDACGVSKPKARADNEQPSELRELLHQGNTFFRSGEYLRAIQIYENGYKEAKRRGSVQSAIRFLNNLGGARYEMFRYREAIQAYLEARDLARAQGNRETLVGLYFNLSSLYFQMGDVEAARRIRRRGPQTTW